MNTGVHKSGGTPEGAWTTTTPAAAPRQGQKKDIDRIMASHGIPYVATLAAGSVPELKDFRAKVARAAELHGFRFLHALGACRPVWRYPTESSVEIVRRAIESRYFPLLEVDEGAWRITYRPKHPLAVGEFLSTQGRFAHLSEEDIAIVQGHIDERWDLLGRLETATSEPVA
jgi:pyruvate ferredoxin oxidoreductase beta subunit